MAILSILLHILLFLLKILLGILIFVLVLLLLVLILPIVYRGNMVYDAEKFQAGGSISWFFRLIFVTVNFEKGKLSYELRLLGLPIFSMLRKRREKARAKEHPPLKEAVEKKENPSNNAALITEEAKAENEEAESEKVEAENSEIEMSKAEQSKTDQTVSDQPESNIRKEAGISLENAENNQPQSQNVKPEGPKPVQAEALKTESTKSEKKTIKIESDSDQKLGKGAGNGQNALKEEETLFDRIDEKIEKVSASLSAKVEKISATIEKISNLWEKITDETTEAAISHVLKQAMKILRSVLPKKLSGHLQYALADPGMTGRALGYYYTFSSFCPNDLEVEADFTSETYRLDTEMKLKGRIIPGVIVVRGLIAILNRDVISTIRLFRNKKRKE